MTAHLPSESERVLYREILAQGGAVAFVEAMQQDAEATLGLVRLGLLVHITHDATVVAVNPRAVTDRLSAGLRDQAALRLAQAERTATQLGDLAQAYDAAPRRTEPGRVVERLVGDRRIRRRIMQIEAEMREETLAAQPGGARPVGQMGQALERSLGFLANGVELRTLYQPGATTDPPTVDYVATLATAGERFRVLDEPFQRMVVFDRKVAVLIDSADERAAVFVEDPAVLTILVGLFERDWARAAIVDWQALAGRPRESGVPPELTDLLAAGLTQRAIASRLGLSERTVAAHLARLREHHGAETLFQLGWLMREGTR
ncbi:LuxR C-terminal-related transcriptional regulator [Kitasatospora sp. NPDC057198]|uniref:LuxR C-terminal-related transcriptional regulator n=1 Tax=Kitasatospora sp. NPDC057198 TaxID=3346046 RepID=UPI00362C20D4